MNIDLEQFNYVGELEITNDIENQSVFAYNCINREPQENVVTNSDDNAFGSTSNGPKDGSSNDDAYESPTESPNANQNSDVVENYAVEIDSNHQLGNHDEFVTDHILYYVQQKDNEEIAFEHASVSQFQVQEEYIYDENQIDENTYEATGSKNDFGSNDKSVHLSIEVNDTQQEENDQRQHRPGPARSGPHIFENCGKSFRFKSRLINHQDQESGLKSFKCPLKGCDSAFNLKNRLKEHLQKTHLKPQSEVASIIGNYSGASKKAKKTK